MRPRSAGAVPALPGPPSPAGLRAGCRAALLAAGPGLEPAHLGESRLYLSRGVGAQQARSTCGSQKHPRAPGALAMLSQAALPQLAPHPGTSAGRAMFPGPGDSAFHPGLPLPVLPPPPPRSCKERPRSVPGAGAAARPCQNPRHPPRVSQPVALPLTRFPGRLRRGFLARMLESPSRSAAARMGARLPAELRQPVAQRPSLHTCSARLHDCTI